MRRPFLVGPSSSWPSGCGRPGGPGGGADNRITTRTRAASRSRPPAWDGRRFGRPPPGPAGLDSPQRLAPSTQRSPESGSANSRAAAVTDGSCSVAPRPRPVAGHI